jgi:carbamoyl-phosphate synthase small subunit
MLTLKVRQQGVMRATLAVGEKKDVQDLDVVAMARSQADISTLDLLRDVTCKAPYHIEGLGPRMAVLDLGIKKNILRSLSCRGFDISVLPSHAGISEIEAARPQALFVSNGPGDPERAREAISAVKHFAGQIPVFGICLGHQIISLALGAQTFKLKFGHHGGNQPVLDLATREVAITSQNHGFAVDPATLPANVKVTHVSLFDGSLQGMAWTDRPALCFQGHPEASPGPHDVSYLFDRFIGMMEKNA